ncbi:MAG: hypothetical protein KG029_13585 [Bacteroidetes bacterium]|jgi:hypothetical protein|nr:hypothetical protein [Bacteroidota bacterium]
MRKFISTGLLLLLITKVYCQINIADSTAQVISYWDKNEKQTYSISNKKIKIQGNDTISRDFTKYEVDITILDSTENGYLINWFYRDYIVDTDNELIRKLSSIIEDINVKIKTDILGTSVEVVNWEEIRGFIIKGTSMLKDELKDIPNIDKVLTQIENMYNSKQAIEASAINEILQFHYFHGLKYKLWEDYSYDNKLANMFGGEPFDAKVSFWLDEINYDDNNAVYGMHQSVDTMQLTNETFNYLTKMAETMKIPAPKREDFPFLHNETRIASRIHGSGWPLYSIQTKEVTAENVTQIDECIIDLK